MNSTTYDLASQFVIMTPGLDARIKPVTPTFYEELDSEFAGFKNHTLVSQHSFDKDWESWEMHPKGDEVVVLLSGRASFVLETDKGEETIDVTKAGEYVVVPKGTWHTARTAEPTTMLFVTPGEDTQHKNG